MTREQMMNLVKSLARFVSRWQIVGTEDMPEEGAYVLVTNHISRLDTPFLMLSTNRKNVIGMIAKDYQKIPFFRWLLDKFEVIWISRGEYDFSAFRTATEYLKKGWVVGLAPEGTRSKTGSLMPGKPGAALMAIKADVQIIPAAVLGTSYMFKRFIRLQKMDVRVRFGKPFSLPSQEGSDNKEWLTQATDEIMCQIAALLPADKRGVYANHPRLKELLTHNQTPSEKDSTNDPNKR